MRFSCSESKIEYCSATINKKQEKGGGFVSFDSLAPHRVAYLYAAPCGVLSLGMIIWSSLLP